MEFPKQKIDLYTVCLQSGFAADHIKRMGRLVEDHDKAERLEKQECQSCFYSMRIGGAAMSTTECGLCGENMIFGSTAIDTVCKKCAKAHRLCKHCGGDIEMKQRRKL